MENKIFLEPKNWLKYDIYWLLRSSCCELFGNGKYGLFWGKKFMERWYLLITEKLLFWTTGKFLFWAFRWWEIRSFFKQNVDVKVVFTWSFWAFYDVPGPGKYEFSFSETKPDIKQLQDDIKKSKDGFTPVTSQNVKGSAINNLLNLEKEH